MLATNADATSSAKVVYKSMFKVHAGWLATGRDEVALVIPVWRKDAPKGVKLVARSTAKDDDRLTELQVAPKSAIWISEQVKYRIIPTGVPFLATLHQKPPLEAATELASDI
jgi:hypothetical protein